MAISEQAISAVKQHEDIDRQVDRVYSLIREIEMKPEHRQDTIRERLGAALIESVGEGLVELFKDEIRRLRSKQSAIKIES